MIYYFLSKLNRILIVVSCIVLVSFGWLLESKILPFDNTILPWSLDSALFALGFYAIGNLLFDRIKFVRSELKSKKHSSLIFSGIFVLCFMITIPFAVLNGHVTLGSKCLNNGFIFYLTGVIGTAGILAISIVLENNKALAFCGRNSFTIMAIHCIIRNTLCSAIEILGIPMYDKTNLLQTIIPFIFVLSLSILFTLIYNKIKNFLLKKYYDKKIKKCSA